MYSINSKTNFHLRNFNVYTGNINAAAVFPSKAERFSIGRRK